MTLTSPMHSSLILPKSLQWVYKFRTCELQFAHALNFNLGDEEPNSSTQIIRGSIWSSSLSGQPWVAVKGPSSSKKNFMFEKSSARQYYQSKAPSKRALIFLYCEELLDSPTTIFLLLIFPLLRVTFEQSGLNKAVNGHDTDSPVLITATKLREITTFRSSLSGVSSQSFTFSF